MQGELLTAWEILDGELTDLPELADLIFDEFTPSSAWATWQLVADGLYFKGEPHKIEVQSREAVEQELMSREQRSVEDRAWQEFIDRVEAGNFTESDKAYLEEVEQLALGIRDTSRVLKTLRGAESQEQAHEFLLDIGFWKYDINPYPSRLDLATVSAEVPVGPLAETGRHDLTHLPSIAIDDEGSNDPDDALSVDGRRLWVHIADVSALIPPDSPADLEARARGANLYLPDGTITMLPGSATTLLALGLSEISPALSFGLEIADDGEISDLEIVPSWIKVTRLSYEEAETRLDEPLFQDMTAHTSRYRKRRRQNGSVEIFLPEVKIRVRGRKVEIRSLPPLKSRELVQEAMLMTGEAAARYALSHGIPMPFTTQDGPENAQVGAKKLSQMFALRNSQAPSRRSTTPGSHSGLGLEIYTQATSPLRRYLDLVVHQQLRANLTGKDLLAPDEIMVRMGAADSVIRSIRRAERNSNKHWTLVYLMQNPDWLGEGIIVDIRGARSVCLIPDLALEINLYLRKQLPLDSVVKLRVGTVDLANLVVEFRLVR
jgi:exoribonuclease-2